MKDVWQTGQNFFANRTKYTQVKSDGHQYTSYCNQYIEKQNNSDNIVE